MLPLHPGLFDRHCFETSLLRRLPLPLSERDQRFVVKFGHIRIVQAGISRRVKLRLTRNSYPGAWEHVDEFIYAETADLSGQQITDARLFLVGESGRLGPGPTAFLNVLAEIEQQAGSYFRVGRRLFIESQVLKYVIPPTSHIYGFVSRSVMLASPGVYVRNGRFVARRQFQRTLQTQRSSIC
jgi:hypothetical protein